MKFFLILVALTCVVVMVTAKPLAEIEKLLEKLLEDLDAKELEEKDIGSAPFGGSFVADTYIRVKLIRSKKEGDQDRSSGQKCHYYVRYGKGDQADDNGRAATFETWDDMKCKNGQVGCVELKGLDPDTDYWVELIVQMPDSNGEYQDMADRYDLRVFHTKPAVNAIPLN